MSIRVGDTVGDYKILSPLGSGGFAQVFKAEHIITKRLEAIKVLLDGKPSSAEQERRFQLEIRVQASLSHPHIAAVHNAFWVGNDLVMVMELVEGSPLKQLLELGRIPLADGLAFMSQVLSALSHAHAHDVVHRDVSPANIIITVDKRAKLTDFGLAKASTDLGLTQSGAVLGSLYYTSPEQVLQGACRVDPRTDVYSAGAVLYEIVTGRRLFEAPSAFFLMQAHVEQSPVPPIAIDPAVPPELNDIILRALAKNANDRFPTAEAFREALRAVALPDARPRPGRALLAKMSLLTRTPAFGIGAGAGGVMLALAFVALVAPNHEASAGALETPRPAMAAAVQEPAPTPVAQVSPTPAPVEAVDSDAGDKPESKDVPTVAGEAAVMLPIPQPTPQMVVQQVVVPQVVAQQAVAVPPAPGNVPQPGFFMRLLDKLRLGPGR